MSPEAITYKTQKTVLWAWVVFPALLLIVQGSLLLIDHHPMFFLGDSASYIQTAIAGWLPMDRSFVYGYFIRLVAVAAGSLTALVATQVMLSGLTSLVTAHLLIRYFRIRPWIAFTAALLTGLEPLQLLYARYVMTETLTLAILCFYVWIVLHYLEDFRVRWLFGIQVLATILISLRFAFIPLVWICAPVMPMLAYASMNASRRLEKAKGAGRLAGHIVLSVLLLFVFTTVYKNIHGHLQHKPAAYSYESGLFALGFVMPILAPADFDDEGLGQRIFADVKFPTDDRRMRGAHRWMEGGAVSVLRKLEPDPIRAEAIAQKAVLHVLANKPVAFLKLGLQTFTDYFDRGYLQSSMRSDLGGRRLGNEFLQMIKTKFHYASDESSALDLKSFTGRYFLRSERWIQLLLFLPLGWLVLIIAAGDAGLRSKYLFMGLISLILIGMALFAVERPTPRYLHGAAWLFLLLAGTLVNHLLPGQAIQNTELNSGAEIKVTGAMNDAAAGKRNQLFFWAAVSLSVMVLLGLKHIVFYNPTGAMLFRDELFYKGNALYFFQGGGIWNDNYPPLYSLLITPAFLFSNWFDVMIRINSVVSTLLAVPVLLLARQFLGFRLSALAVILTLLLPFQLIFPGYLLSENLFLPIFVFAVWLTLKGADAGRWTAAILGVTLACAYLTRFLMLPAIPLLVFFWLALPYATEREEKNLFPLKRALVNLLILCFCFAVVYVPWLIFAGSLDIPLMKSLGFGISGVKMPHTNTSSLFLWLAAYAAYVVLAAALFLLPFCLCLSGLRFSGLTFNKISKRAAFVLLILLLTVCYWLVSTNHSFSAGYNQVKPQYLLGRYLMFLTPLYIVAGLMALKKMFMEESMVLWHRIVVMAVVAVAAVFFAAWWILHDGGIWGLPGWFAHIEFNSPDAFSYHSGIHFFMAFVCMMILGGVIWAGQRGHRLKWLVAACGVLIAWQAGIYTVAASRLPVNLDGLHARHLATVLLQEESLNDGSLNVYYDLPAVSNMTLSYALAFWGTAIRPERLHPLGCRADTTPVSEPFLLLTKDAYPLRKLLSYPVGRKRFHLYKIDETNTLPEPVILQYGPDHIQAGRSFNRQPDGASAMWLKTSNATPCTVVVFKNSELRTVVASSSLVTAAVPDALFAHPGKISVCVKDRLTGKISPAVTVHVSQ